MKCSFCYVLLACCLIGWAISRGFAADADGTSDFAFSVSPNAVALTHGEEATAVVLLQNTGATVLENVRISSFSNPPMHITIEPVQNQTVPPKATLAWKVAISREASREQAGTVFFRADFTRQPGQGDSAAFSTTAVTSLAVTNQPLQKVEELLDVKCETAIESLNEKRPGVIYLRLKSQANVPLNVGPVTTIMPSSIEVAEISQEVKAAGAAATTPTAARTATPTPTPKVVRVTINSSKVSLQPYETRVLGFTLKAAKQVTPGKQTIAFEVPVRWEYEGRAQLARETVTQSIDVGVFGETAVLAAIGIPTFLFLPGFLVLMTFAGLWKMWGAKSEGAEFPLKASTAEFYVVAITISILAFWIYPGLTARWTGIRRDFTESYGLTDVVYVWLGSIVVGAFAFGIFAFVTWVLRMLRALLQARIAFATDDQPLQFLAKLGRLKRGLTFDRFNRSEGAKTIQGFVIDPSSDPNKTWVAPEIVMDWSDSDGEAEKSVVRAIERNDTAAAVKALKTAKASGNVSLRWFPSESLNGPQLLDNIKKTGARGRILRPA